MYGKVYEMQDGVRNDLKTQADIDSLCQAACYAWGRAPGGAYKIIFVWRNARYASHLTSFRVLIQTLKGSPVAECYSPAEWPMAPPEGWQRTLQVSTKKPRPMRRVYGALTPRERFAIFARDGYRCRICGASSDHEGNPAVLHVDHITPRSKGGTNDPSNLWTLCSLCNIGKGTQDL